MLSSSNESHQPGRCLRAGLAAKIRVITGATSGIGRMAAQALGALNADLIFVRRSEHAGHDMVGRLRGRSLRRRVAGSRGVSLLDTEKLKVHRGN